MDYKQKRRFVFAIVLILLSFLYFLSRFNLFSLTFGSIFALILFYLGDHFLKWELKFWHYAIFVAMVVFGFIMTPLYFKYPYFDKVQHFIFPLITCFFIYHVLDRMNLERRWKLWFTLTVLITTITLFEIYEYIADFFWNAKLQGVYDGSWIDQRFRLIMPRIDDTMVDLMIGILGGITFIAGKLLFKKSK